MGETNTHVHRARYKQPEQGSKTKISPKRAEYVRDNINASMEELQEATGLGEWVIEEIILIKEADFMRAEGYEAAETRDTKFDNMPQEMRDYLRDMDYENLTQKEFKANFNSRWDTSELTPLAVTTLRRYWSKLQNSANLKK